VVFFSDSIGILPFSVKCGADCPGVPQLRSENHLSLSWSPCPYEQFWQARRAWHGGATAKVRFTPVGLGDALQTEREWVQDHFRQRIETHPIVPHSGEIATDGHVNTHSLVCRGLCTWGRRTSWEHETPPSVLVRVLFSSLRHAACTTLVSPSSEVFALSLGKC
jgi:hypothetical protein